MNVRLPEFADPPVSEVAISVEFLPLEKWRGPHAGMFWAGIADRYPRTETQQPLLPQLEPADGQLPLEMSVQFGQVDPELQRFWFLTESSTELIQVQRDRFVVNWRQIKGDEEYPRYTENLRPRFIREWMGFSKFVSDHSLGITKVRQCEITYVNDFIRGKHWETFDDALALLSPLWHSGTDKFLPRPMTLNASGAFAMSQPASRLYFSCAHTRRGIDNSEVLQLRLTARGRPSNDDLDAAMAWLDVGHEWVVRGFSDMTSSAAHKAWGRKA